MQAPSPPPVPAAGTRKGKRDRLPLLASTLAWPGVGQFMQGRPLHGIVYAGSFTLLAMLACVFAARQLRPILEEWIGLGGGAAAPASRQPLLLTGGLLLFVYAANLYDVWLEGYKRARSSGRKAAP